MRRERGRDDLRLSHRALQLDLWRRLLRITIRLHGRAL